MKRYISFFIALTMVLSLFNFGISANAATEYSVAENFAFSLGVADKASYNPDALVTRAEFAEIIARYAGLKDPDAETKAWNDAAFGADSKDEPANGASVYAFSDIDVSLEQYEAISAVCAMGYMNGVTSTHFLPNYSITMGAAVKVIVCMLGYEAIAAEKGGWPNGYMSVATSLGIRSGVTKGVNDFVTYSECLELLYNTLDVAVYDFAGIGDKGTVYEKGDSFLNTVMEIYRAEGVMTDNGITTLYGSSKVGADSVVVDGVRIYTDDASYHSARYLGREVEAYYRENKSGKNELVHMEIMEDDSVSFAPEMFISLKSGKLTYEDDRGRVVSETIDENAPLIYNNTVYNEYSPSKFNFPSGTITLLKSEDSNKYDIIVVEDYAVGRVKKVDSANEVMYIESMYKNMSASNTINLASENGRVVTVKDTDGNKLSAAEIKINSVASVVANDDASYVEVIISTKAVNDFVVESYQKENTSITLYSAEDSYTIGNLQYMASAPVINVGESYDILLDFNGVPAWIEKGSAETSANMAFLIQAGSNSNGFNKEYAIQLYTQNALIETFTIGERVELNNASRDTEDVISEIQAAADEVILYTTNEDGTQIKSITLPLDMGEEDTDNRGWYHITPKVRIAKNEGESDKDWAEYVNANGMMFSQKGTSFNKAMHYAAGKTKVFSVPTNRDSFDDERKFSTTSDKFNSLINQTVNGYATNPNAILADAVAWSTSNLSGTKVSALQVFLITKITRGLNEDEEEVTYLNGYIIDGNGTSKTAKFVFTDKTVFIDAKTSPGIVDPTSPDFDMEANGPARFEDLEVGDIIRYSVNDSNELVTLRVAYDCSTGKGYTAGTNPQTVFYFYEGGIDAGYPLYVEGTHVRLSSDLPHNVDMTDKEYMLNYQKVMACDVKANTVFVVEDGVRGKTVRKGSIEDIQTFEDTGELDASEYDRVAVPTYWGLTIGTIIYK